MQNTACNLSATVLCETVLHRIAAHNERNRAARNTARNLLDICTLKALQTGFKNHPTRAQSTQKCPQKCSFLGPLVPGVQHSKWDHGTSHKFSCSACGGWGSGVVAWGGLDEIMSLELRIASAPEGAAASGVQAPNPKAANEGPKVTTVPGLEDTLADLSVDPEVLGTFLATMAIPIHLLLRVSASPSPPPKVMVPGPHMMHLTGPSPPLLPPIPSPPPSMPVSPPATTQSEDRLTEPPVPLAQRLTNPPLATRIGNLLLRDWLGETGTSNKQGWDKSDMHATGEDEPPPKKKKTRGLRSGKDEQKKCRSKVKRAAEGAEQTQGSDTGTVESGSAQVVASGSNIRLEDLEEEGSVTGWDSGIALGHDEHT
ncbi:hypothetical protein DFH08DRAFT_827533 [Mycena albidolilacea]|uniref:Uncharacterized protein n=1 Tax=Mycena albidolilacea TaxID=1033008 RepID=A0AAD6YXZ6_9AGAR|nr:hypothetical protein DFH08DRAFT_827533 [Mycena albidolilacea]